MTAAEASGVYLQIAALIRGYIELHKGEAFTLDTICQHLQIQTLNKP